MKNDFARRVSREVDRRVAERQGVHTQMCLDAAMLAANDCFHMGPTRCADFAAAFSTALHDIAEAALGADVEYAKTVLDARLEKVCGEQFQPWDVRYGG